MIVPSAPSQHQEPRYTMDKQQLGASVPGGLAKTFEEEKRELDIHASRLLATITQQVQSGHDVTVLSEILAQVSREIAYIVEKLEKCEVLPSDVYVPYVENETVAAHKPIITIAQPAQGSQGTGIIIAHKSDNANPQSTQSCQGSETILISIQHAPHRAHPWTVEVVATENSDPIRDVPDTSNNALAQNDTPFCSSESTSCSSSDSNLPSSESIRSSGLDSNPPSSESVICSNPDPGLASPSSYQTSSPSAPVTTHPTRGSGSLPPTVPPDPSVQSLSEARRNISLLIRETEHKKEKQKRCSSSMRI
ncbi:uncharacterized protein LY89DRAFT_186636 [Mollisia scopiformis]|uniref:Uncharacterized protein n=1 Tax=Mollisia scopiformis TaxID=149040 RepID=A0A194XTQ4_MOLSC|nr:uncharacterized protein LY89DRAFT_186636 [Mollisia scopiformis]KUJ23593.1 hypothetical protein LY89DRAFT_186636 [Mollisia scopiformis]